LLQARWGALKGSTRARDCTTPSCAKVHVNMRLPRVVAKGMEEADATMGDVVTAEPSRCLAAPRDKSVNGLLMLFLYSVAWRVALLPDGEIVGSRPLHNQDSADWSSALQSHSLGFSSVCKQLPD
jgi:hypothetical protein